MAPAMMAYYNGTAVAVPRIISNHMHHPRALNLIPTTGAEELRVFKDAYWPPPMANATHAAQLARCVESSNSTITTLAGVYNSEEMKIYSVGEASDGAVKDTLRAIEQTLEKFWNATHVSDGKTKREVKEEKMAMAEEYGVAVFEMGVDGVVC